jgi:hypothetical protein
LEHCAQRGSASRGIVRSSGQTEPRHVPYRRALPPIYLPAGNWGRCNAVRFRLSLTDPRGVEKMDDMNFAQLECRGSGTHCDIDAGIARSRRRRHGRCAKLYQDCRWTYLENLPLHGRLSTLIRRHIHHPSERSLPASSLVSSGFAVVSRLTSNAGCPGSCRCCGLIVGDEIPFSPDLTTKPPRRHKTLPIDEFRRETPARNLPGHFQGQVNPKPKCLNRHEHPAPALGTRDAMIGKAQKPNTVPDVTAPHSVVGDSGLTTALASLGGPGCPPAADLAVKRFPRIRVNFLRG